jgi:hypothetical protein
MIIKLTPAKPSVVKVIYSLTMVGCPETKLTNFSMCCSLISFRLVQDYSYMVHTDRDEIQITTALITPKGGW